ncbi:MAG: beta-lactamase family protein [Gemmatimonadaceae bacterium]|nr:beta-lactamase family protein [Gemmatimonadaceae bacterium]
MPPTASGATRPARPAITNDAPLHTRVAAALRAEQLVGVSWALVTPDTVRLGAAGLRDAARGTPLSPDDRMQVGSVTKALLATGVLALVTQGRVALDDDVATLLPMLRIENPWAAESPLRLRHLLDHTGGLDDVRLWQVFTTRGDPDAPLRASIGADGRVRIRHRPGERFSYSNTSFLLLGMVVEAVTGERYEAWLDRALLLPLGMTRSTFGFVSQRGHRADSALAMGHFDGGIPQDAYAIPVRPAAQFTTTPADMARFARFLMGDGRVDGRALVRGDLLRAMAVPTGTEAARAGLASGYALGLMRRERWGLAGKCHLGNIGTFRAVLCIYPEAQRAFFASYNADPEGADFDGMDSLFAAQLAVPTVDVVPATPATVAPAEWSGWYTVRPSRFEQFAYLDAIAGVTRVRWDGRAIALSGTPGATRVLEPVGGALFRMMGRRTATHVLTTSPDGARVISDGLRTYERVSPSAVVLRWLGAAFGVASMLYLLLGTCCSWGASAPCSRCGEPRVRRNRSGGPRACSSCSAARGCSTLDSPRWRSAIRPRPTWRWRCSAASFRWPRRSRWRDTHDARRGDAPTRSTWRRSSGCSSGASRWRRRGCCR